MMGGACFNSKDFTQLIRVQYFSRKKLKSSAPNVLTTRREGTQRDCRVLSPWVELDLGVPVKLIQPDY